MRFSTIAAPLATGALLLGLAAAASAEAGFGDASFVGQSRRAMDRMMAGMTAPPSGNADRDFAAMMIPHHQGAIDMAVAELRFGHDERLRRIAQEIIVDQQQEIVVMQGVLSERTGTEHGAAGGAPAHTMVMP